MANEQGVTAEQGQTAGAVRPRMTAEEWYRQAYLAETEERFLDALKAYRQALVIGGRTRIFATGWHESCSSGKEGFSRRAVPADRGGRSASAWNSLGIVLEELGEPEEAVAAYQLALQAAPGYTEVHCHLAARPAAAATWSSRSGLPASWSSAAKNREKCWPTISSTR